MRQLKSAALAAGLLGCCVQLHAAVPIAEASIDWTSFSYQLFDLDPFDGVAPSLAWGDRGSITNTGDGTYDYAYDWSSPAESSNGVSVASVTESSLTVSNYGYRINNLYGSSAQRYGDFTLSAMTLVVFEVAGSMSVAAVSNPSALAGASVQLSVSDYNLDPYSFNYSVLNVSNYDALLSKSGVLTTSFANITGAALTAQMGAYVQLYVSAPVPEPHAYGMLLAGLAVVAPLTRRRCAD